MFSELFMYVCGFRVSYVFEVLVLLTSNIRSSKNRGITDPKSKEHHMSWCDMPSFWLTGLLVTLLVQNIILCLSKCDSMKYTMS